MFWEEKNALATADAALHSGANSPHDAFGHRQQEGLYSIGQYAVIRLQRRANHLLLVRYGHVFNEAREEYDRFAKEFGSARKELYSAEEEFCLAKLLS
jgi:hypothetical protein